MTAAASPPAAVEPPFVREGSIVRRIWGDGDMVLFVFGGSAAEFALNRSVDWLFFTGAIPRDPIGRLFSTAAFAQRIAFAGGSEARAAMAEINRAHAGVERARGGRIPEWAYRDVLYMLIAYSERAHELLDRPLTPAERDELFDVFRRIGEGLGVVGLPGSYEAWRADRELHLERDLAFGELTAELYRRYREALGPWRYAILLEVQALLVPARVRDLLSLGPAPWQPLMVPAYRALVGLGLRDVVRRALLPAQHLADVRRLDLR